MVYTSIENNKIKDIKKLNNVKYRNETNLFLIEGEHLVLEAYKKGFLKELIVLDGESFSLDVDTIYVSEKVLKYISELETPQKIMGICHKKEDYDNLGNKIMMLDSIQDPGNLGAIIRSAVAFNIDTLVLSDNTVDLYNSKVLRASQGMNFHLNIISGNLADIITNLKSNGYKIMGTNVEDGKSLRSLGKAAKFVIIMGNEGYGISKEVKSLCDEFIYIRMNPKCESLNVGVAAGIILYELDK